MDRPPARRRLLLDGVRATHSLPAEMAVLALTVLAWQLARVPFEVSVTRALDGTRDLVDLERALGIAHEGWFLRGLHARPALHDGAEWWYSNMDETLVFAVLAAMRLVDPRRFATVRTAFVLVHVPAIAVVALVPSGPPRWLPESPLPVSPPVISGDLRNATAAAVSLHVGVPLLLAIAAVWMRPRAPLAWLVCLLPPLVLLVVVATGNHLFVDGLVGAALALVGWWAARALHGPVPRGRRAVPVPVVVLAAVAAGGVAYAANLVLLALAG